MLMKFCIVLLILLLAQATSATEDELPRVIDDIKVRIDNVKQQLSHSPDVITKTGESQRRLNGLNPYTKILGFYQFEGYLDSNEKLTCDTSNSKPALATGVAYGCVDYEALSSMGISSYGLTCEQTSPGSITLGASFYKGAGCTGGVATVNGLSSSMFDQKFECGDILAMTYACEGPILPASKYDGYRVTTFLDNSYCMGQVFSYYNHYKVDTTCLNGNIVQDGTTITKTSCYSSSSMGIDMSISSGCISKMSSTTNREFLKWDMRQTLIGIDLSTWSGDKNAKNIIAFVTTLSEIYGIDYNSFVNIEVTTAPDSASSGIAADVDQITPRRLGSSGVSIDYTIMVQPGFGNSYTKDNIFSEIETKHKAKVSKDCTGEGCFTSILSTVAADVSVSDLSGVTPGAFDVTSEPIVTNGIPGGGNPNPNPNPSGTASDSSSGGGGVGIAVGVTFGVGIIISIGYYKCVYQPKQEAARAAAQSNAPPHGTETANPVQTASAISPTSFPPARQVI